MITYFIIKQVRKHRSRAALAANDGIVTIEIDESGSSHSRSSRVSRRTSGLHIMNQIIPTLPNRLFDDEMFGESVDNVVRIVEDVKEGAGEVSLPFPAYRALRFTNKVDGRHSIGRYETIKGTHAQAKGTEEDIIFLQLTSAGLSVQNSHHAQVGFIRFHEIGSVKHRTEGSGAEKGYLALQLRDDTEKVFYSKYMKTFKDTLLGFVEKYTLISTVSMSEASSEPPPAYRSLVVGAPSQSLDIPADNRV